MPAYDTKLQLKAAGAQASSTSGTAADLGSSIPNGGQLMQYDLAWTAFSGTTPTADIIIEESPDTTTWRQVTTFRQLNTTGTPSDGAFTGANSSGKKMARFGLVTQRYMRYRSVLGGAGVSLNFSLNALALDAVAIGATRLSFQSKEISTAR